MNYLLKSQFNQLSNIFRTVSKLNNTTPRTNAALIIRKFTTANSGAEDDKNWISIPSITVCGIGGGGCNSVNNMIKKSLYGVDFVVANTDAQALQATSSAKIVQLGKSLTRGLGAGAVPQVGKQAAEESIKELMEKIGDTQMLFVTAGMGGGTGTGGAAVVAAAAKERGILTVGIVTKPFHFEGRNRMRLAEIGLSELEKSVDSLIVIPNQKLMEVSEDLYIGNAFQMVDDVLYNGIKGISDILVKPGLINLDFADVRSVMCNSGKALMGVGEAEGKGRDQIAAQMALNNPLLENINISGAKGVLLNISGSDLKLHEVDQIVSLVSSKVDPSANIIFGSTFDQELDGKVKVTLIVTGMGENSNNVALDNQYPINVQQTQHTQQIPQQQQQTQQLNVQQQQTQQPPQQSNIFSGNIKTNQQQDHPLNQNLYPYQQFQQPQQQQQVPPQQQNRPQYHQSQQQNQYQQQQPPQQYQTNNTYQAQAPQQQFNQQQQIQNSELPIDQQPISNEQKYNFKKSFSKFFGSNYE
ncbi:hypothetical protein CYY_008910 [Polysphondylium violaceum]|uniref:Mitochondrial cell division protein n=1 Tax=Polysphondylium violaceum TaxID=133409 RepID=A0A8J4PNM9_9MYCE|nr:hypothetical protein CYY_008910 [Polysphondylium violaceum]